MKTLSILLVLGITSLFFYDQKNEEYFNVSNDFIKKYDPPRKDYVIVVDYRKNILQERLYVINMRSKTVEISSRVSHAFNSGVLYPSDFSNVIGSNKSSKGCYITSGTKYGRFGFSMIIQGKDKGINNNAKKRHIIFHSNKLMKTMWSQGCFATPEDTNKEIINMTKNGCLVVVID